MKINTALILCAGFGKRLNPITLKKPKPLIEINNVTMLEKSINLIKELGINKIILMHNFRVTALKLALLIYFIQRQFALFPHWVLRKAYLKVS